ncbi:hypothetical protein PIB30_040044 [Stylosanthes scabra]|uniref:Uncharacterized protein n=1 Tax=Stylosanthes scabra TaxID=79078 RepID=A0ABU6TGD9_9FABA|nr:hypothetical protein [Stylosanthes scabra]
MRSSVTHEQYNLLTTTLVTDAKKREKYEDYDKKANAELGVVKIRQYHFDDEAFVHPLHDTKFDPDRPYELPIESLLANQPLSSSKKGRSSTQGSRPSRQSNPTSCYSPLIPQYGLALPHHLLSQLDQGLGRPLKSWELIPPFEGWICEGDEIEKEVVKGDVSMKMEGAKVNEKEEEKKVEEEEEDLEEDVLEEKMSVLPRPMDEDYLQYLEEL